MLKPTWRSQQRSEEQAEAEAAAAVAAEEPDDFDTGQAEADEAQGSDVADEDIDKARADDDDAVAEPESEPGSEELQEANRKEGADDQCSDEDLAEDGALPAEEDALPVLPQVLKGSATSSRAQKQSSCTCGRPNACFSSQLAPRGLGARHGPQE